ncbi:MAG: RHS repeat-associated core domain-containing protein [Phycisphaerales bacterium]
MILTDTDPDPWNDAGTGTLSVRQYMLQNWRADVVATARDDGLPHEYIRYSPYGIPTSYPAMDANRDMQTNSTDETDWLTVFSGGSANIVIGIDTNKDGLVPDTGDFDFMADEAADTAKRGGYGKVGTATGTAAPLRFAYIGGGMSMMGQGPAEGDKVQDASASLVTKVDEEEGEQLPPSSNNNQAPPVNWEVEYWLNFVWDGWNLMDEIEYGQSHARGYAWGLDLSGSLQGAGSVGGLLWETIKGDAERHVCTDGNGNVTGAFDDDGYVTASIVYGPFGETLTSEGDNLSQQMVRFSSKYSDEETGLVYYGYRYYSPGTGRWISIDPSGTMGGDNLLALRGNSPTSSIDFLGLWVRDTWSGERGVYSGTATAECGDTLAELARLITGTPSDAGRLNFGAAGVKRTSDVVAAGTIVDVSPLLSILENRLRTNVANATSSLTVTFSTGSAQVALNPGMIDKAVNPSSRSPMNRLEFIEYFFRGGLHTDGNAKWADCNLGTRAVMVKGLADTVGDDVFDAVFKSFTSAWTYVDKSNAAPSSALLGDSLYLKNSDRYAEWYAIANPAAGPGEWQGEYVIKLRNDVLWGHGIPTPGSRSTYADLSEKLRNATNTLRPAGEPEVTSIHGYTSEHGVRFFNVPKVGMEVFDYRKRNK